MQHNVIPVQSDETFPKKPLIVLGIIIFVIFLMILWPNVIPPVWMRNANAAQDTVHQIYYSEKVFQSLNNGHFGALEQLKEHSLLELQLESNSKDGYRFDLRQQNNTFVISATPIKFDASGRSSYFMDGNGILHVASREGQEANAEDPICLSKTRITSSRKD